MDAFDADVLIYAAAPGHPLGRRVLPLLERQSAPPIGSTLLLPELLTKPIREHAADEIAALIAILSRLALRPCDEATATTAVGLGATYGLRAADAVHLATAVVAGAERFITNNASDFPLEITELAVTYPETLEEWPE
jgi:predicted nucleic acid-binding protein